MIELASIWLVRCGDGKWIGTCRLSAWRCWICRPVRRQIEYMAIGLPGSPMHGAIGQEARPFRPNSDCPPVARLKAMHWARGPLRRVLSICVSCSRRCCQNAIQCCLHCCARFLRVAYSLHLTTTSFTHSKDIFRTNKLKRVT